MVALSFGLHIEIPKFPPRDPPLPAIAKEKNNKNEYIEQQLIKSMPLLL